MFLLRLVAALISLGNKLTRSQICVNETGTCLTAVIDHSDPNSSLVGCFAGNRSTKTQTHCRSGDECSGTECFSRQRCYATFQNYAGEDSFFEEIREKPWQWMLPVYPLPSGRQNVLSQRNAWQCRLCLCHIMHLHSTNALHGPNVIPLCLAGDGPFDAVNCGIPGAAGNQHCFEFYEGKVALQQAQFVRCLFPSANNTPETMDYFEIRRRLFAGETPPPTPAPPTKKRKKGKKGKTIDKSQWMWIPLTLAISTIVYLSCFAVFYIDRKRRVNATTLRSSQSDSKRASEPEKVPKTVGAPKEGKKLSPKSSAKKIAKTATQDNSPKIQVKVSTVGSTETGAVTADGTLGLPPGASVKGEEGTKEGQRASPTKKGSVKGKKDLKQAKFLSSPTKIGIKQLATKPGEMDDTQSSPAREKEKKKRSSFKLPKFPLGPVKKGGKKGEVQAQGVVDASGSSTAKQGKNATASKTQANQRMGAADAKGSASAVPGKAIKGAKEEQQRQAPNKRTL